MRGIKNCPEVFCEKGLLRNFAKFTEKHLFQSLFFNKSVSLRPATLLLCLLFNKVAGLRQTPFFQRLFIVVHETFSREWVKSTKTGTHKRSITKSYFTRESDSELTFIEESAFKDDQINAVLLGTICTQWNLPKADIL